MKLGILGGSFNPVHLGHLFLADTVISALKLDRIVMIPAHCSPFKLATENTESSANDRLDMLAAAVAGDSRIAIDPCEIRRGGISYTVNTLEDIIERFLPDGKPALIIGDDLADDFPKWRDSEKILELADIVIARRLNSAAVNIPYPHTLIDNEVMDISSHLIRQRISEGGVWRSLVPSGVRAIIEDRRLYNLTFRQFDPQPPVERMEVTSGQLSEQLVMRVEDAARETLTVERFLHSKNTALLAYDLCRRFDLDPIAGYLAGIAHDMGKQLDGKHIMKLAKMDDMEITSLEKDKPGLMHGRAAAVLLKERFGIHNEDVLEAIAAHTSGKENMGPLAKVIYIADKTEVSRSIDYELRRICKEEDLDSILYVVLNKTVSKLQSRELDLSEETKRLMNRMKERNR